MEKQVDKDHYREFGKYLDIERWDSIFYQIKLVLDKKPESVLEVGPAVPVFRDVLKLYSDARYMSLDIAEDLNPDVLGSVNDIPLENNSVDIACAFQVLEHLPYEKFDKSLSELARVSKKYVIISLPYFAIQIRWFFKIPKFGFKGLIKVPLPFKDKKWFGGQHYWEIGKRGFSIRRIEKDISKIGKIEKKFTLWNNPYHRFYVIELNK